MKKIVSIVGALCITLGISAQTVTGTAVLKIYSANSGEKSLTLIQADEFSDAYDASYDAEAQDAGGIYIYYNNTHYTMWASNALSSNLPLGFATGTDLNYQLKFDNANFSGTTFTIYDSVKDETITVNGSNTDYDFTIASEDVNKEINDRFIINYVAPVKQICFNDEKLQLTKYAGAQVDVYLQGQTTAAKSETVASNALQEINLSDLAAGEYVVKIDLDGDAAIDEQYRITVKPTVSAYTPAP